MSSAHILHSPSSPLLRAGSAPRAFLSGLRRAAESFTAISHAVSWLAASVASVPALGGGSDYGSLMGMLAERLLQATPASPARAQARRPGDRSGAGSMLSRAAGNTSSYPVQHLHARDSAAELPVSPPLFAKPWNSFAPQVTYTRGDAWNGSADLPGIGPGVFSSDARRAGPAITTTSAGETDAHSMASSSIAAHPGFMAGPLPATPAALGRELVREWQQILAQRATQRVAGFGTAPAYASSPIPLASALAASFATLWTSPIACETAPLELLSAAVAADVPFTASTTVSEMAAAVAEPSASLVGPFVVPPETARDAMRADAETDALAIRALQQTGEQLIWGKPGGPAPMLPPASRAAGTTDGSPAATLSREAIAIAGVHAEARAEDLGDFAQKMNLVLQEEARRHGIDV